MLTISQHYRRTDLRQQYRASTTCIAR